MEFNAYGLLIGLGILAGIVLIAIRSKQFAIPFQWFEDALIWIAVPSIIGARVYHLLTDSQLYQGAELVDLIAVWRGGIGIFGAIIGGVLGLLCYAFWFKKKKIDKRSTTTLFFMFSDLCVFGVPIGQAVGRTGNYVNQELYGKETTLPWGIEINGSYYHPLFAYEAVLLVFLCVLLHLLAVRKSLALAKGQYTAIYLIGYGCIRFWLEFFRLDSARFSGFLQSFTVAQWIAVVFMSIGTIVFWARRHAVGTVSQKEWDFSFR